VISDSNTEPAASNSVRNAGLISRFVMGIVFLVAGLPKVWDPAHFYWEIVPFTFLFGLDEATSILVARMGLVLGPVESIIGLALLLNWRPSITFPLATGLMAAFTALVTSAWMEGYDASCGCFGSLVERSAGEAVVEDVAMLGLLLLAWAGSRAVDPLTRRAGTAVAIAGVGLLVLGTVQLSGAYERISDSDLRVGVSLTGLQVLSEASDLLVGERLIVVMSPTCERCRRSVPRINRLIAELDGLGVVAVTHFDQESAALTEMVATLKPVFPIATVTKKDFMRLAWGHGVPRMAMLRDGEVVKVWEAHELPDAGDVKRERLTTKAQRHEEKHE
jgi:hypothetical protein